MFGDAVVGPHLAIINDLVGECVRATQQGESRIIVLRGPSGCGKSTIVRGVYEGLAARQPLPAYWPPLDGLASQSVSEGEPVVSFARDPMPMRKVLGPAPASFIWDANALPEYGWWTFECSRTRSGFPQDIVASAIPLLEAHAVALRLAVELRRLPEEKRRLRRSQLVAELQNKATDGATEALSAGLGAMGVTLPALSLLMDWGWRGIQASRSRSSAKDELAEIVEAGMKVKAAQTTSAFRLATTILELSGPEVPCYVAVEDAHEMGQDLAHVVDLLMGQEGGPVVALMTVWPEGWHNPTFHDWYSRSSARGLVQLVDIPALEPSFLEEIVLGVAPHSIASDVRSLCSHLQSPYLLKLWLTGAAVSRVISESGSIPSVERVLDELPIAVEERWRELPDASRSALRVAAAALPTDGTLTAFSLEILEASISTLEWNIALREGLDFAIDPAGWCGGTNLVRFRERLLQEVAKAMAARDGTLSRGERDDLRAHTIAAIKSDLKARLAGGDELNPGDSNAIAHAEWLLGLVSFIDDPIAEEAAWLLARVASRANRYSDAVRHVRGLDMVTSRSRPPYVRAQLFAVWLEESGKVAEAHHLAVELRDELAAPDLVYARDIIGLDMIIARCLGEMGRARDAMLAYHRLLDQVSNVIGADSELALEARASIAHWQGECGDLTGARAANEGLIDDARNVLGPGHRLVRVVQNNLAGCLRAGGDASVAVELMKQIVSETGSLAVDNQERLNARQHLARCLDEAGRPADAHAMLSKLRDDCADQLGALSPVTLSVRDYLARQLGERGEVSKALEAYRELVSDRLLVQGARHPDTLRARAGMAHWLGESDRLLDAGQELESLLPEMADVVGTADPAYLQTKGNLGRVLLARGMGREAREFLENLTIEAESALGPNHPITLESRLNCAEVEIDAGESGQAIRILREVHADACRVSGDGSRLAIRVRTRLEGLLSTS